VEQFSDAWFQKYAFKLKWVKTFHDENGNEAKDDGSFMGEKITFSECDSPNLVYAWLQAVPRSS